MGTYSFTGAIQKVTVNSGGTYDITAYGAQGGNGSGQAGGSGAEYGTDFTLAAGEKLEIVTGGAGAVGTGGGAGGGGGGSFVLANTGVGGSYQLLLAAGGGGGGALAATGGAGGYSSPGDGFGGGESSGQSGGGSGHLSDGGNRGGQNSTGGYAGGTGGASIGHIGLGGNGGFGGGGGGGAGYNIGGVHEGGGGGGGGYSGGQGGSIGGGAGGYGGAGGGGGTSFDSAGARLVAGSAATENAANSGNGLVSITPNVACYCRGAAILTAHGDVAVEKLRVGDLLVTASGAQRPIKWIGLREVDISRHRDPEAMRPVRVSTGAFGEGLPQRDLWLSPGHNIASEGVLIPISALINGVSVTQVDLDRVEYWHVELDTHDLLIAEGVPAESYLDCGNRAAFSNGGVFIEAHPDFTPKHWAETCLPIVKEGAPVTRTKARLLARLAERGDAVTQEADAHVLVDSARVEPIFLSSTRLAFLLPANGHDIELRSQVFVPAHTVAESTDPRALGLCVGRLQIDGSPLALDDADACASGWREAEFGDGRLLHRWTNGVTPLPARTRVVIIDLAGAGHYWRREAAALPLGGPEIVMRDYEAFVA